ncbi:MAG: hypothetical protein ACK5B3_01580 [Bacteroidota bacterium]|jgi:GLPGLI family protein
MKRKLFTTFLILSIGFQSVLAQVNQGKIIYKIDYPGIDLPADQKAMLPSESTCYFSNNNCRTESDGIMGMKMVTICVKDQMTILMDVMGKKIAMNPRDNQSMKTKTPTISYSDEIKKIAGHNCKKATLIFDENTKMIVWYAEDITGGGSWGGNFKNLKGAPLEYTADLNGMSMTMTASKVSAEKVSKKKYEIPSGYEFMTPEQLQRQFK